MQKTAKRVFRGCFGFALLITILKSLRARMYINFVYNRTHTFTVMPAKCCVIVVLKLFDSNRKMIIVAIKTNY